VRKCVRRVCDGDCDNCSHPDCIDEDGYWDYATPEERVLIRGPKCPERTKAMNALSRRRCYHTHPEQRQRMRECAREWRTKAREDPEKLSRVRESQRKYEQKQERRNRKSEWARARYLRNREEILRRAKERYRQRKAAPGGDDSGDGKGKTTIYTIPQQGGKNNA